MLELANRFSFEGHRIAWGTLGEGPPLVLVHGTPFSSQVWRRIAPWLARRHRVYFYDLLGYDPAHPERHPAAGNEEPTP